MQASRPHIVMLFTDQHRADCLGHAGHPLIETPHLDRMAAEGLRFTQADTPCPVCAPARQSLVTGQWPHNHTGICLYNLSESRSAITGAETLFPRELQAAGYRCGFIGKWHVSPDVTPEDAGYTDVVPGNAYNAYREERGIPLPAGGQPIPPRVPEPAPCAAEDSAPVWSTRRALDLLEGMLAGGGPCMLSLHLSEPHPPYGTSEPWASMYHPSAIPPWPNFDDPLAGKPYIQRQMRHHWQVEDWTWDDWAPHVAASYGAVSCVDHCLGMLMEGLERLGIADDTLLVYSTDHGDLLGAHGMYDKHNVLYEEILRVPLLMRWPGRIAAGSESHDAVSNCLDLAPTFMQLAGREVSDAIDGRSLLPQMAGESEPDRDAAFASYHGGQFGLNSQRSIRHDGWKYVFNATDVDELYDLTTDPGELHNLADDADYRARLRDLRQRLAAHFHAHHDPLFRWQWMRGTFERDDIL